MENLSFIDDIICIYIYMYRSHFHSFPFISWAFPMEFSHPPRSVSSERISSRRSQSFPLSNLRNNEILREITGLTFVRFLSSSEPGYIFFIYWPTELHFVNLIRPLQNGVELHANYYVIYIKIYNVFCKKIYIYNIYNII